MLGLPTRNVRRYTVALAAATAVVTAMAAMPASATTVTTPISAAQHRVKLGPLLTWAQVERQVAAHPNGDNDYAICLWNHDSSCMAIAKTMKTSGLHTQSNGVNIDWQALVDSAVGWGVSIFLYILATKGKSSQEKNEGNTDGDDDYEGWYLDAPGNNNIGAANYSGDGTWWQWPSNPNGGDYMWNTNKHEYVVTANPNVHTGIKLSTTKSGWYTWGFRADL